MKVDDFDRKDRGPEEETEIDRLHREACEREERTYLDPESGYLVFTEIEHRMRGYCCRTGCRHCPYGFRKRSVQ